MKKILIKIISVMVTIVLVLSIFANIPIFATTNTYPEKYSVSEIIVKYKSDIKKDTLRSKISNFFSGTKVVNKIESENIEVIDVKSTDKMETTIAKYKNDPNVEYVVPNDKLTPYSISNEPLFEQQWYFRENILNAAPAWDLATGNNVLIGVMDTGIDLSHPDLKDNIVADGWDFVNNDNTVFDNGESEHGTNVAGVIAAAINNTGIVGVAPNAKILPLKIIEGEIGYVSDAIEAIEYAKSKGVKIVNCSWGTTEFNYALKDAISNSNMLFVCATGNKGESVETFPAAFGLNNVISVGSIDQNGNIADFTNSRQTLDLYAPGVDILTTAPNNSYKKVSGTSLSAAFVTGIAALLCEAVPTISETELALVVSKGYSQLTIRDIKIANAYKSVISGLPLNYIKDENGRLSQAMKYSNLLITPEIAEILTRHTYYNQLISEEKKTLNDFFNISDNDMVQCYNNQLNIVDSVVAILASRKVDINLSIALTLINQYENPNVFDSEMNNLKDLWERIELNQTEKDEILTLLLDKYKVVDIAKTLIFSKVSGLSLSNSIATSNHLENLQQLNFNTDEKEKINQIIQLYNVDHNTLIEYISNKNLLPSELFSILLDWQSTNNFYIVDSKITPYTLGEPTAAIYNKYKMPSFNYWSNGNSIIDKTDGMVSYEQSLFSLAGKNGIDLNLGLRFDPEVSDTEKTVKDSDLLVSTYTVTEKRVFYSEDLTERLPNLDCEYTYLLTDINTVYDYISQDGMSFSTTTSDSIPVVYYKEISVQAQFDTTDYLTSDYSNYYNNLYGLGVGWALNLPSIEYVGTTKYLHFPNGSKYKINNDNTLDGYFLDDISFSSDNSFTVNSVTSAHSLTDISGITYYFSSDGKYIGSKDLFNNTIQVFYNSSGIIDKIIDTTNREIYFTRTEANNIKSTIIKIVDSTNNISKNLYTITQQKNAQNQYVLTRISNGSNNNISFEYTTYDTEIVINDTVINNAGKSICISAINSQSGVRTEYTYTPKLKKYGVAGTKKYYSVINSCDKLNNSTNNSKTYEINNIVINQYPIGIIYPAINDTSSGDAICIIDDVKYLTKFNENFIAVCEQTWSNEANELKSESQVTSLNEYNQATEVLEKTYSDNETYTLIRTQLQWDSLGNCISQEVRSGDQNGLSAAIDDKSFSTFFSNTNIVENYVKYSYTENGEYYGQKTVNSINSLNHKIIQTQVFACKIEGNSTTDDKLLYKTNYSYNLQGQVTKTTTTYANDNHSLTSSNSNVRINEVVYDNYGVYPTQTKVYGQYLNEDDTYSNGIKDTDGHFILDTNGNNSIYITNNTYNILGQIVSTQINDSVKKIYIYDESTNDLIKTEYYDGTNLLGDETKVTDYINNTVINKDFNDVYTKVEYDQYGNVLKTYRQTDASVGTNTIVYYLLEKNVYDAYQRLTDNYSLLSTVLENTSGEEDLNASNVKFKHTINTYDEFDRIVSVVTKDQSGETITSSTEYAYESGVQYGDSTDTYNTITKTMLSGNSYNETFKRKQYLDSLGRVRIEEHYNGETKIYTNQYTYSDFNTLTSVSGETVNSQSTTQNFEDNSITTSYGTTTDQNGVSTEVTSTEITNGLGETIQTIDGNGNTTYYHYDILGRLIRQEVPVEKYNNTIYYSERKIFYDIDGNVIEEKVQINSVGEATKFSSKKMQYDIFGRVELLAVNTSGDNYEYTQYYYEGISSSPSRVYTGQISPIIINGLDNVSANCPYSVQKYEYDYRGKLIKYTDALGKSDTFEYDIFTGATKKKNFRNGKTISYEYDTQGNLIKTTGSESGADSIIYTYEYDLLGNLLSSNGSGIKSTYEYDNLNRIIAVKTDNGNFQTQIAYLYTGKDLMQMSTTRFDDSGMGYTVAREDYTYNETGYLDYKVISTFEGNFINETEKYKSEYSYGYDSNGNVKYTAVSAWGNDIVCSQFSVYSYDMSDRITKISTSKESQNASYRITIRNEEYDYSLNGQLTNKQIEIIQNFDDEIEDYVTRNYFTNYEYNNAGVLTSEENGIINNGVSNIETKTLYSYDLCGNRVSEQKTDYTNSSNNSLTTYTYNAANRLIGKNTSSSDASSQSTYTYDFSGNLLTSNTVKNSSGVQTTETTTYTYDALNRTSAISKNGTETSFKYDENNRRISKTTGENEILYVWNNDQMLFEVNSANLQQNNYYILGISGEVEGVMKNSKPFVNTLDLTGNVVNSLNLCDHTEYEVQYDAFGNILYGQTLTSVGYSGEYMDTETGLYYLKARIYDPELGRFTQEDDWLTEGPNLYIYCNNNPVLYSDPTGHCNALNLVYYRKKGDMATLEKLKRIIANGDCDPQYHFDESQIDSTYILPAYSITQNQYDQIKNSVFNGKFKQWFYFDTDKGYSAQPSLSYGAIQLFSFTKYFRGNILSNQGWVGSTYIFISGYVSAWKQLISFIDIGANSFMNTLRKFFDSNLFQNISLAADELVQTITGVPNVGTGVGLVFKAIDSIPPVIIDPMSRYFANVTYGKEDSDIISVLFAAYTWYNKKSLFSNQWSGEVVFYAYPWSNRVINNF